MTSPPAPAAPRLPTPPPLLTQRLCVRPVQAADLPDLLLVNGDERVTRHLPYATWRSLADAQAWFDRIRGLQEAGGTLQFVLAERGTARVLGSCLLFRHDAGSARAELGYVLGHAHWGQGLMAEALRALLAAAFGDMGLRRIEAEINPANTASVALAERLGFVREGLLRQRWVGSEGAYDVAVYGLLATEFRPG